MASVYPWCVLGKYLGHVDHREALSYDESIIDYYSIFVPSALPPDYLYLSYACVTSGCPRPTPGENAYFFLAEFYRRVVAEFSHAVDNAKFDGGCILGTGSGLGGAGKILAGMYPGAKSIVCVDLVEQHIEFSKASLSHLAPQVSFECGDVCSMSHSDHSFNIVFDEVVVSHLRGKDIQKASEAMHEFRRVLVPEGFAVLSGYARAADLEDLLVRFSDAGFKQIRCANITAANAEGALLALEHMFGHAATLRASIVERAIYKMIAACGSFTIDEFIIKFGLVGCLAATCQSRTKTAELLTRMQLELRKIGCAPSVLDFFEEAVAQVLESGSIDTVAAVPESHVASYGVVLDALMVGLFHCIRRARIGIEYKPCWVVVLQSVWNDTVPRSRGSGDLIPANGVRHRHVLKSARRPQEQNLAASVIISMGNFGLPIWSCLSTSCNSVATMCVLAILRMGRLTRTLRTFFGVHRPRQIGDFAYSLENRLDISADQLSECRFVREYLEPGLPMIARNAVVDWPAMWKWTPEFFSVAFGEIIVTVQGDHFQTHTKMSLRRFLAEATEVGAATRNASERVPPSLRYALPRDWLAETLRTFGMFGSLSCIYGDSFTHLAFLQLQSDWEPASFLPKSGYTYPWTLFCAEGPQARFFYDFGVYISPRGAVTRLHVDGQTNAVLMLVCGEKRFILVPPVLSGLFVNAAEAPDDEPLFEEALAALPEQERKHIEAQLVRCVARAGDLIFIPQGWAHEVYTEEFSIMVTYNFIHSLAGLARSAARSVMDGYGGARLFRPGVA